MHLIKNQHSAGAIALLIFLLSFFTLPAYAQSTHASNTGWLTNQNHLPVKARFVLTGQVNSQDKTVAGFLEVKLSDDWKTYWRSPGEGGIAPSMTWDSSTNINDIDWDWPLPKRFDLLGIETLGYKGSVIFPMTLHVDDLSKPTSFNSNLTLSSCTTICVLTDYPFELTFVPSQLTLNKTAMHAIAQGISQVPRPSALVSEKSVLWDADKGQVQVSVSLKNSGISWQHPDVLLDGSSEKVSDVSFTAPTITVNGNTLTATFNASSWLGDVDLENELIAITIADKSLDGTSFLAEEQATIKSGIIINTAPDISLIQAFLFALIGGLILNIMPCVFPVLGMKLNSVITSTGLERKQIRYQFIASALGIFASFMVIAIFLTALKLSGSAIGWGIQFQNPWFIGLMIAITALFSLSMFGLFEVRLPSNVNTWVATRGDNSYTGHFTQGMFATLLATPCSAPFLGTAVTFALATNIPTLFAIFAALAIGMGLPWLLIAVFPSLVKLLPKPGNWLNKVRIGFGIMMLVTSIWLLSLLAHHLPLFWVLLIGLIFVVALMKRTKAVYGAKTMAIIGVIVITLSAGAMIIGSMATKHWVTPLANEPNWVPLSTAVIKERVANGQTVFVDVTAQWCVTCKANKIGVLLQDPVYSVLQSPKVVPMQGDWTTPSESVTQYLQANNRFGVPFNIVYGPNAPQGIPLPVILSSDLVLDAIRQAGGLPKPANDSIEQSNSLIN